MEQVLGGEPAAIDFSGLRLPGSRTTWCNTMLIRIQWRRWIVLLPMLGLLVHLSVFVAPTSHRPASINNIKKSLRPAVYLFDTRTVFSCEEFESENLHRPLVNMKIHAKDQWNHIRADLTAFHPKDHASPECLVKAGLLVL